MLHYSLWARSCPLARSTVITLSSLQTGGQEMVPRAGVPRAECILKSASTNTCACAGKLFLSLGLDVRAKGNGSWGEALGIIWERGSAHQILMNIFETNPIFFLFLMNLVQLRLRQYLQTMGRKRFKNNNNRRALAGNNLISPNSPAALETGK